MARTIDGNGWMQVIGNPITKAGIFPYLGSEIGAPEPDRVYRVYRPAEELQRPETLDSFKLLPFIDDHTPLGSKGVPAEQVGIQGVIGEQVYYDHPYVRANIKVLSNAALAQIGAGRIELSPGYSARYEFTPGIIDGEAYDAIQRDILGNHLALVDEGRTGPDVAMQDKRPTGLITIDTAELLPMEFTPEQLAQIKALIAEIIAAQSTGDETPDDDPKPATGDQDVPAPATATPAEGNAAEAAAAAAEEATQRIAEAESVLSEVAEAVEEVEAASEAIVMASDAKARKLAMDQLTVAKDKLAKAKSKRAGLSQDSAIKSLVGTVERLTKQVTELKKPVTLDTAALLDQLGKRDDLANRLSQFIGTFDAKPMTLDAVAKYGVEKLGLKVPAGSELIALDSWLHGRVPEHQTIITGDAAKTGDALKAWESN